MTPIARIRRRRRLLLVVAAVLASLEVGVATLAAAAAAQALLAQEASARVAIAAAAAVSAETPSNRLDSGVSGAVTDGSLVAVRRPAIARPALGSEVASLMQWRVGSARPPLTADAFFDRDFRAPDQPPDPEPAAEPAVVAEEPPAPPPPVVHAPVVQAPVVTLRIRIPDLRIDRTTLSFPCDRAAPPDNYVYRWGCAGANNLYLLGHASTVFKPLHDAYASGQLWAGMPAWWTDARGNTWLYRVTTWRIVRPDETSWAIASQPVPSMTLQTCYGANSEYRLLVRLVIAS